MNYARLALAALGATITCFAVGGLLFVLMPSLIAEVRKYPAVYRPPGSNEERDAGGAVGDFHRDPDCRDEFRDDLSGRGGHRGCCALPRLPWNFRGLRICAAQLRELEHRFEARTAAYFLQWAIVGIVIGVIYKPLITR